MALKKISKLYHPLTGAVNPVLIKLLFGSLTSSVHPQILYVFWLIPCLTLDANCNVVLSRVVAANILTDADLFNMSVADSFNAALLKGTIKDLKNALLKKVEV